jgi:lactoylglutathione lyase
MQITDVTPNLIVTDIERSVAFYRDRLGFTQLTQVPDQPPYVFVWMQRGGANVFLNARGPAAEELPLWAERPVGGTASLFFALEADSVAEGIDALFASVSPHATVVMPLKDQFYGMREFGILDPDGYVIFFAQRIG